MRRPHQPASGQASPFDQRLPDEASVRGPSCQGHWGRRRAHPWTEAREPPLRPVSVTADGDKQQVCAGRPPGRATRRPTPRSSECQTGSDGLGRGRATPDTLKVKTSHVMPPGRAPASSLPPYPPALTSLPATPPRRRPPVQALRLPPALFTSYHEITRDSPESTNTAKRGPKGPPVGSPEVTSHNPTCYQTQEVHAGPSL